MEKYLFGKQDKGGKKKILQTVSLLLSSSSRSSQILS